MTVAHTGYLQGARALGSRGEPIQHEQGGTRVRKTEMRLKEKSSFPQHEQGLGALRSSRITHMTPSPRMPGCCASGAQRHKRPSGKRPSEMRVGGSGEEDDDKDETERSSHYFQGFEDEGEEREGVGPGPEPPRIVPSRYEPLEPEETPRYWQKFSGDRHLTIHGVPPPGDLDYQ
jgi:hypothetical protein